MLTLFLAVFVGLVLGAGVLIPSLQPASLLLLVLPFVPAGAGDHVIVLAGVMTGVAISLAILEQIHWPISSNLIAYADVAKQLAQMGYRQSVLQIHRIGTWVGVAVVAVGTIGLTFILYRVQEWGKFLTPWLLVAIFAFIAWQSARPILTALIMGASTALGLVAFRHPMLDQSDWLMFTLLGGLFMTPTAWGLLTQLQPTSPAPEQISTYRQKPENFIKGGLLGMLSGFIAGLGASSLTAALHPQRDREDYFAVASASEAANATFALMVFWLLGSTRSGTAAVMATYDVSFDPVTPILGFVAIAGGVYIGMTILPYIEKPYQRLSDWLNPRYVGFILLLFLFGMTFWHLRFSGVILLLACVTLTSLAKSWQTPNQALLTVMGGPVVLYYLRF